MASPCGLLLRAARPSLAIQQQKGGGQQLREASLPDLGPSSDIRSRDHKENVATSRLAGLSASDSLHVLAGRGLRGRRPCIPWAPCIFPPLATSSIPGLARGRPVPALGTWRYMPPARRDKQRGRVTAWLGRGLDELPRFRFAEIVTLSERACWCRLHAVLCARGPFLEASGRRTSPD